MYTAILLSALAMTAIVGLRYLATSGLFAWATARVHPGLYAGLEPQIRKEIAWSLASAGIYGVPAGVVAWGWQERGWTRIYTDVADFPLWYLPLSLLLYLFVHDTWFYWTHRWMHRPKWFRLAHAVHHASRPPTAWAAMSFHPIEALTGAFVIPLTGIRDTRACRHLGAGARHHDAYGGDQSYGLGDVPALACSYKVGKLADNRQPSPAAS